MWQFIMDQVAKNQFLSGGAVLASIGILLAYLRSVPGYFWRWIKRRLITEIDIPDRDMAFSWLNIWLANHPYHKRCRLWTVHTCRQEDATTDTTALKKSQVILSPAPGIHFLFYKRRLLILRRDRLEASDPGKKSALGFRETFHFTLFSRNKQIVFDLLNDAKQTAYPPTDTRVIVLRPEFNEWFEAGKRLPRSLSSVILANNSAEKLLADILQFQSADEWYNSRGIPYRRGYLLHGKPGNGKSSLVIALASALQFDICCLNLSASSLDDERLMQLVSSLPRQSILLIEDIDCIFQQRKKTDDRESITFSGLLNAIDGVMASEGRILFMTTNHIDTLDPALIRPGRVDISLELDNASRSQMEQLFLRFFPDAFDMAKQFSTRGTTKEWSMATLQGHLLKYRENPVEALTNPINGV